MSRWVIRSVNAGILILCCFLVASLVNRISAEILETPAVSAPPPVQARPAPGRSWDERRAIVDRNLFGAALEGGEPVVEAEPEEDLAPTKLPLRLLGTAATPDVTLSTAAVEDLNSREHEVLRVGDRLRNYGQVQVVRIEPRRIVLQNGARREELALDETSTASARPSRPPARRAAARPTPAPGDRRARLNERLRQLSENRYAVPRQEAEEVSRNPAVLLQDGRPIPKYEDGAMVGFQLTNVKPGGIFDQFGIENGEVITEVNGIAIDSPTATTQIMAEFANADTWNIVVNGRPITITLD